MKAKMHIIPLQTFLILTVYCLIAIFSTVLSKPKNDFISRLASCSKHVQCGLSGCTYTQPTSHLSVSTAFTSFCQINTFKRFITHNHY